MQRSAFHAFAPITATFVAWLGCLATGCDADREQAAHGDASSAVTPGPSANDAAAGPADASMGAAASGDSGSLDASSSLPGSDGGMDASSDSAQGAASAGLTDASSDGAHDADAPIVPPTCETAPQNAPACLACTHQGWVEGAVEEATCQYLGIPYAKPPSGALRFSAPEPAASWPGVRRSTAFGAACMQTLDLSFADAQSEDCLFVNVWTPSPRPAQPLPVMVFIYGGGFSGGATNTYSGVGLSRKGPVVVVSMNYRVGALGFFAHPELDGQRAGKPSGSDGIRDQQLALQWVRDNISSFGGDPHNVTVFGESAGSSSVCIHLVSPGSRKLARRFIMESGVCTRGVANGIEPVQREKTYARAQQLAADLCAGSADTIGCLRGLPAEQLMAWTPPAAPAGNGAPGIGWVPVIEGPGGVLPEHPDALIARGDFNRGEVIVGTNRNEYGLFNPIPLYSREELQSMAEAQYGARAGEVMALYAPSADTDPYQALVTLMTDVMFRCPSRGLARMLERQGGTVYLYSFEQGSAWHAEEMTYLFGYEYLTFAVTPPVASLADAMQRYWTNFASRGDPNGDGLTPWPRYDLAGDRNMTLVDPPAASSGLQRATCDFWDSYLASP
jgi:para-nitrobenzyl esterase